MGVIKDVFFGESTTEQAMNDTKWILFFIAGNIIMIGFVRAIVSLQMGLIPLGAGLLFLALAFIPQYHLRLLTFIAFTLLLWADFLIRHNPFSIVYSVIGIYHIYLLLRWKPQSKKEGATSS